MASQASTSPIQEPFPIFSLAHKYLVYDPNVIAHIRQAHNISGVLIGSLPQAPQQNVFLGVPLELMPEEARLLVEKQVAYIVDDVKSHKDKFLSGGLSPEERQRYQDALRKQGALVADETSKRADEKKRNALKKVVGTPAGSDWNDIPEDMLRPSNGPRKKSGMNDDTTPEDHAKIEETDEDESLFAATQSPNIVKATRQSDTTPFAMTPTTSQMALTFAPSHELPLPDVPVSYSLYKHMHSMGYFLSPGLRFGCQYTAYPGDPLRFHSHFLCSGMNWDQEFDLLDLVGGGRLGTGVKKGYLIGGKSEDDGKEARVFCIEWASM